MKLFPTFAKKKDKKKDKVEGKSGTLKAQKKREPTIDSLSKNPVFTSG